MNKQNTQIKKQEILEKLKTFGLYTYQAREELMIEIGDILVREWEQGIVVDEEYIKNTLFTSIPFINADLLEGVCTYTFEAIKDLKCCGVDNRIMRRHNAFEKESNKVLTKKECLKILDELLGFDIFASALDNAMNYPDGQTIAFLIALEKIVTETE